MRRKRLYCKCGERDSEVVEVGGKPIATCKACGSSIPLTQDTYGKWHPARVVYPADQELPTGLH